MDSHYNEKLNLVKDFLKKNNAKLIAHYYVCLLYTSPSPRDLRASRMPSSA